ncbi:MAG: Uma2 family endonuclease [Anaerolineae bacterium]
MTAQEKITITVEEYLALPESSDRSDLIEGEIIVSPAPSYMHQACVFNTAKLVDLIGTGTGITVISPMDVYILADSVVQPDVFWVRHDSESCVLRDNYWYGAPDLVIEVLSPSTEMRDRGVKYDIYERSGVREYWLINVVSPFIEVYTLHEGKFQRLGVFTPGESFESLVLAGHKVETGALFGV